MYGSPDDFYWDDAGRDAGSNASRDAGALDAGALDAGALDAGDAGRDPSMDAALELSDAAASDGGEDGATPPDGSVSR
jgi:hypothetical protein